jgi:hypothetical protein
VSVHNPGAHALAAELEQAYPGIRTTPASAPGRAGGNSDGDEPTHLLLYLNFGTYLDDAGKQLAEELRKARAAGMPVVMAHENDPALGGCEFARFFSTTPQDLIDDGLYKALAFACYPGEHHAVSMALLAKALGAVPQAAVSFSDLSSSTIGRLSGQASSLSPSKLASLSVRRKRPIIASVAPRLTELYASSMQSSKDRYDV